MPIKSCTFLLTTCIPAAMMLTCFSPAFAKNINITNACNSDKAYQRGLCHGTLLSMLETAEYINYYLPEDRRHLFEVCIPEDFSTKDILSSLKDAVYEYEPTTTEALLNTVIGTFQCHRGRRPESY